MVTADGQSWCIAQCANNGASHARAQPTFTSFLAAPRRLAGVPITRVMDEDGIKYVLEDGSWLLIRCSGTESVLRLYAEERAHGVHVGMVLPGFIETEGFPAAELKRKPLTRWLVSSPERVAEAIHETGPGGRPERYVPRYYALAAVARVLLPGLVRRVLAGSAAADLTTATGAERRSD